MLRRINEVLWGFVRAFKGAVRFLGRSGVTGRGLRTRIKGYDRTKWLFNETQVIISSINLKGQTL